MALESKKLIFSFDIESDGLYGEGFAVGVVIIDVETGRIINEFSGVVDSYKVTDRFTKDNIVKYLREMPKYPNTHALREAFWKFYIKYRTQAERQDRELIFLADNCAPVEARFLRDCVMDDHKNRKFQAPFPLIDLATVLLLNGYENHLNRRAFSNCPGRKHHPLDDAAASGLTFWKLVYGKTSH